MYIGFFISKSRTYQITLVQQQICPCSLTFKFFFLKSAFFFFNLAVWIARKKRDQFPLNFNTNNQN